MFPVEQRGQGRKGDSELKYVAWFLPTKASHTELKKDGVCVCVWKEGWERGNGEGEEEKKEKGGREAFSLRRGDSYYYFAWVLGEGGGESKTEWTTARKRLNLRGQGKNRPSLTPSGLSFDLTTAHQYKQVQIRKWESN